MRYKMWEDSSLRKPHFSAISGSVILMRSLIAVYVILCGTGRHWRYSSVNIPTFQLVQGSEGLSRDFIQLQKDDRRTEELSRIYSKKMLYIGYLLYPPRDGDTYWGGELTIYSVVHLIPYLIYGVAGM